MFIRSDIVIRHIDDELERLSKTTFDVKGTETIENSEEKMESLKRERERLEHLLYIEL